MVSSHRVLNDCNAVILQFDRQMFIELQHGFVCVADLQLLTDHPCDLPSRQTAFFFLVQLLLEWRLLVSVDDLFETTCCLRIFALVIVCDVFRSAIDCAHSISLIHTIGSVGRLAPEDTSLPQFFRQILKFRKPSQLRN